MKDLKEITKEEADKATLAFRQITMLVMEADKIFKVILNDKEPLPDKDFLYSIKEWQKRAQVIAESLSESYKYA